ncbi:MAG: MoxR family ATPase [Polyangiaceae bacterium]|nr:MoxR family ATPase [Polyangiaceae bacterium]
MRPEIERLRDNLAGVIQGKGEAIELLLVGLLSGGHMLLEDVPGSGKTTLAKALARSLSMQFSRVQFTPDLLPADILGSTILRPGDGTFSFQPGPIFTNVLLADEINRASPRTQSALLEAMNEAQVTVDGQTHPLPSPFLVIATQNPVDFQGTYPLPESQLDRFLLRFALGYPPPEAELAVLFAHQTAPPLEALGPVMDRATLLAMQAEVRRVEVREPVARYLLRLVVATREHPEIELGVSTRGALAYFRAAQARAFLAGRSYVSPDDVQRLAGPVLAHRLALGAQARYGGRSGLTFVQEIVSRTPVPT